MSSSKLKINKCRNNKQTSEWSRIFGGIENDAAYSVQQVKDGGYIVTGRTESFGKDLVGVFLVRFSSNGKMLWRKAFGRSKRDMGFSVQQTNDGGYIIAGVTESFGEGKSDVFLVKTDSEGNEVWSRTFGRNSRGRSIQQTTDGGYIIAGSIKTLQKPKEDVFLVKTDSEGNEIWSRTYGGSGSDRARSVQQTNDGGYIIAGVTESFGEGKSDVFLVKTDSEGNEVWSRTFGGPENELAFTVQQTMDKGYIVAGTTQSYGKGNDDFYLVKTDSEGNEVWSRTFGGPKRDIGFSGQQTNDGGYIIVGFTMSFGINNFKFYLVKTDSEGNEVWSRTFGDPGDNRARSVQQTNDGGYIIAGQTNRNAHLIKFAPVELSEVDRKTDPKIYSLQDKKSIKIS